MKRNIVSCLAMFLIVSSSCWDKPNGRINAQEQPHYNPSLLFDGFSEDCRAYCWYDIRLGETSTLDFLNFLGDLDFETGILKFSTNLDINQWVAEQSYQIDPTGFTPLTIQDTKVFISGYELNGVMEAFQIILTNMAIIQNSPKEVFSKFGVPSEISFAYVVPSYLGMMRLAYEDQGIYFQYEISSFLKSTGEFCLYPEFWLQNLVWARITIVNPNNEHVAEHVQNIYDFADLSLNEVTELTIEEVVELVMNEDEPCIPVSSELWGGGEVPSLP